MSEKEEMKKEGAKGFAVVLSELEDGALHSELSTKLQSLLKEQTDHAYFYQSACVGKLQVGLTIKCDEKGVCTIVSEVKVTPPKRKRSATTMYVTPGNNLSVANPRQLALGVREVPAPRRADAPSEQSAAPRGL